MWRACQTSCYKLPACGNAELTYFQILKIITGVGAICLSLCSCEAEDGRFVYMLLMERWLKWLPAEVPYRVLLTVGVH